MKSGTSQRFVDMKLLRQASVFEGCSRALVESNPAGASSSKVRPEIEDEDEKEDEDDMPAARGSSSSSSSFSKVTIFRRSRWDALFLALALVHGALLVLWPSLWLIGLGMWWNANTISHNFI